MSKLLKRKGSIDDQTFSAPDTQIRVDEGHSQRLRILSFSAANDQQQQRREHKCQC
eukprot:CAMPEP_0115710242 /NCGR_PEP_ID=MMETSP0272-20121206/72912_1 /TAXON_ID=71861 /ORGANISM="Scrippsiella trochoidea, Strain CCMP3099" /LENGTH=55 /DNA_ID=CAMNT_0003151929 /DNA_START=869 /DNA_END=1033 /DNA_ORIENTATION=+